MLHISIPIMSWFWTITFLSLAIINTSESKPPRKASAVVAGTVYCDTCFGFQHNPPGANQYLIAGASVVVQCKDTRSRTIFQHRVETDSHGEFNVHLPFPVSKHVTKIRGCSVRLVSSNRPYCAIAASAASSALRRLKSRKDGTRVFSAGFFTFRPLKQPDICDEKKPSIKKFKKLSLISNPDDPAFLPPIQDPPSSYGSFLPPLPPLPQLPRLPPLPRIPFLPPLVPEKKPANDVSKLKENEAADDAILFTPNSFDLRVTLPPLFPSPNSPPLLNLPPIHGLTPSLPPPPPFGLPPFPFPPTTPGFPGVPPAEVSAASEKTAP